MREKVPQSCTGRLHRQAVMLRRAPRWQNTRVAIPCLHAWGATPSGLAPCWASIRQG